MTKHKQCTEPRLYASPDTIYHLLDCGRDTILEWEKSGKIVQDVHFIRLGAQRRYHVGLMEDRLANFHDDAAHSRAVEAWRSSLLSNQVVKRGKA